MIITKGKVKYAAGAPREGQYGPSINVLVVFNDGKEARIYGKPGDPIQNLKTGEIIDVLDDKGKYKYIVAEQPAAPTGVSVIDQQKQMAEPPDLAALIFEVAAIYSQGYVDIYNKLAAEGVAQEHLSAATSTIFIQVSQKIK
jgi:hypothetical protein